MQITNLYIRENLWMELITGLKKRGQGKRESGGFLLGKPGNNEIIDIIYLDDLDPFCLKPNGIAFKSDAYVKLWQECNKRQECVLADVHTHPSKWTGQSPTDIVHPMIPTAGHIALIVPFYAKKKAQKLNGVGVYEYLGGNKWETKTYDYIIELI